MSIPFGSAILKKANVPAAALTDVFSGSHFWVAVTAGSGPITSFGTAPNRFRLITFETDVTVTNNDLTLQLPGSFSHDMKARDAMILKTDGSGNVICTHLQRWHYTDSAADVGITAAGRALVAAVDAAAERNVLMGKTGAVTRFQLVQALNDATQLHLNDIAIPDDPTDTARMEWDHAFLILQTGPLGAHIKSVLGYTDPQMTTLFTLAGTKTP